MGLIGPTTSPEFLQHFTNSTIPRIANAARLSGFETTEQIEQFFQDEFNLNIDPDVPGVPGIPGDIGFPDAPGFPDVPGIPAIPGPSQSTIGLMPMDVFESDFHQQVGFGDIPTPPGFPGVPGGPVGRLGFEEPFPEIADSQFLPFAREAAGDDPNLYSYLLGQIPELQQGFRTARQGFERQLSLENLQQATQFAQSPERLADLEARLERELSASVRRAAGEPLQPGEGEADIEALRAAIAQQRANLTISENLPAFRRSQAADVQRQGEGFSAEGFFEKRRAGLIEGFRSTATGFAGEVAARRRAEADMEADTRQAETERRRKLRGRGRTVLRV
jgi:hypothetical protein